jgi:hypothetical protein
MKTYRLYVEQTIGHSVDITAESQEEAETKFYSQGLPGLMFLDHEYPDEGEWVVAEVDVVD